MQGGISAAHHGVAVAEEVQFFYEVKQLALAAAQFFAVVEVKYVEAGSH